MNSEVTAYINKQVSPQREICEKLRDIIYEIFPKISEQMKLGVPWYEDKFYIVALKNHVNLGFALKDLTPLQKSQLQGGGKIMKHLSFKNMIDIDKEKIHELLKIYR